MVSERTEPSFLPGMEPPSVPAVDHAAGKYYDAVRERRAAEKREEETFQILLWTMEQAGLTHYRTKDGLECTLSTSKRIGCKRAKGAA